MENVLINYLREPKTKKPRGVIVAVKENNEVFYGYSLYNPIDKWNRELGIKKAIARAKASSYQLPQVLERKAEVCGGLQKMQERALRYFKDIAPENLTFQITEEID